MPKTAYKRVLVKLSGEAFLGSQSCGVAPDVCHRIAHSIQEIAQKGVQVSVVVGGGNIFRGVKGSDQGIDRTPADQIGMLATLINGMVLQQALERAHCPAKVLSAISCSFVESYSWKQALD